MLPRFVDSSDILPGDRLVFPNEGLTHSTLVYCEVDHVDVKEHGVIVRGRFFGREGEKYRSLGVLLPKTGEILLLSRPQP